MTTPGDLQGIGSDDRPVPDTADLRILAELINHDWIPLGQAAFNARMSLQEAALRLATMAVRGMPLRLIAEGDRRTLWQIAQAGPATGGMPDQSAQSFAPPADLLPQNAPAFPVASPPVVAPHDAAAAFPPAEPPLPSGAPQAPLPPDPSGQPFTTGPSAPAPAPAAGFPPVQVSEIPPAPPTGFPQDQAAGFPPAAPTGFPQDHAAGFPPAGSPQDQPAGFSPAQSGGFPQAQPQPAGSPSNPPVGFPAGPAAGSPPVPAPDFGASGAPSAPGQFAPPGSFPQAPSFPPAPNLQSPTFPPAGGPAPQGGPPPLAAPGPLAPPAPGGFFGAPPAPVPPTGPVPPHEQAIAGAVPLGEFPFGLTGAAPVSNPSSTGAHAAPDEDPERTVRPPTGAQPAVAPEPTPYEGADTVAGVPTWGLPGSSDWTRTDEPDSGPQSAAAAIPAPAPEPATPPAPVASPAPAAPPAPVVETPPREFAPLRTIGVFGEHLVVQVTALLDPADAVVTASGLRLDTDERAILLRTTVHNASPIDHGGLPDQFLTLLTQDGRALQKAALSVPGHPVHRVGIPAGTVAEGWTLFLVPASVSVQAIRWDVRPEAGPQTLHWPL